MSNFGAVPTISQPTTTVTALNGWNQTVNVLVRRATQYMPMVKSLSKEHWVTIFAEISDILADNRLKRKCSRSASSCESEAPNEEEATQEYVLVSDNDE